jgi:diguanylate cyclase (GGDEF)-like protein/PAS domain S-box-containing protein
MKDKKLLIVEDELLISRHIEQMAQNLGYQVVEVTDSGEEALNLVREKSPDLVLMDIRLKGAVDGIEAATRIWKQYSIPIVYLTAYADEDTLKKATSAEPFGYLIKPFEEKELLVAIEMAFYKHQVETRIKDQQRWLNAILSSIADGVLSTDHLGRVNFINPIGEDLLGKRSSQIARKNLEEVFLIQDEETGKVTGITKEIISSGLPNNRNLYLLRREDRIPVELKASLIKNEQNEIVGSVLIFRDITLRKLQEERLSYLAIHDSLTGLPNRLLFIDRLKMSLEQAKRKKLKVGVLMLDLDFFKTINDTYGHSFGDLVLIKAAKRLSQLLRKSDTVARFGGDEFMVLLGELSSVSTGLRVADRIVQAFNLPFSIEGRAIISTASIGLAIFPDDGEETEELIKKADIALYAAKEAGRNNVRQYSE